MRRILAISLLILFSLPLALPFLSVNAAAASVPICCRKNGKHHCVMSMNSRSRTSTIGEKCPYRIATPAVLVLPSFTPSASAAVYAGVVRHPAAVAQEEARQRVSFDRSRQKRGPPSRIA